MPHPFGGLLELKQETTELCDFHLSALNRFHQIPVVDLQGMRRTDATLKVGPFSLDVTSGDEERRISITSAATCVRSLVSSPGVTEASIDFSLILEALVRRFEEGDGLGSGATLEPGKGLTTRGLNHLNPFTVGQALALLKTVGANADSAVVQTSVQAISEALAHDGVSIQGFPPNGYLTYWAMVGLAHWQEDLTAAKKSVTWSGQELHRQIALFQSDDDDSDPYQLGYNLLLQYRFNRQELRDGLVELALRIIFGAQLQRGVWEKGDPLFVYGEHGNAYCFSFEFLSSVLNDFEAERAFLVPHEENLARALHWAVRNRLPGFPLPLWRSGARVKIGERGPESWATAEVYRFLQFYRAYLAKRIHHTVVADLKSTPASPPDPKAFSGFYQPSIDLDGRPHALGGLLGDRLIQPLAEPSSGLQQSYSLFRNKSPRARIRSGILFGPPRTGKTSYVRAVGAALGWPVVILDPGDFAREGLPNVANLASRIFDGLMELEDTVVFFDEMEQLMRTRAGPEGSFEAMFLTTAFLPKLQDLHDRATCLFFVATNHFKSMDEAIREPGRFDFRIQILPPSYEEKLRMIQDVLSQELSGDQRSALATAQDKIALATLSEMRALIPRLESAQSPNDFASALKEFAPVLFEEARRQELDEERNFNSFPRE